MRSIVTRTAISIWVVATAAALVAAPDARAATERIATGFDRPVFLTAPPGDYARVFIVEAYTGNIKILRLADRTVLATPFVTVPGVATTDNEQGLLGLAFDPDYATNGYFYVNYTDPNTRVVRYHVSEDPNVADPLSAADVLTIVKPQTNHNGGWLAFGPDGYLYVSTGDGGGANDVETGHTPGTGNAQDTSDNLLGKILRLDVHGDDFEADPSRNYASPPTNPFVGQDGDDEIWAFGLRNPWRPSFDRLTGDLYIADVGQSRCEEIDVQPASSPGGENYGWRLREGLIQTPLSGAGGPKPPGAIDPIFNYPHPNRVCGTPSHGPGYVGISITGGYVYRGPVASMYGRYFFIDFSTENLWSFVWDGSDPSLANGTNFTGLTDHSSDPEFIPDVGSFNSPSSFGEDAAGNLYLLNLGGSVFQLPEPARPVQWLAALAGLAGVAALRRSRTR